MKKRKIGHSDLYVSELGLGCMSLGTDEQQAVDIIHTAIDQGMNYLDTADLYDQGLNEEFVGKAIKQRRDDIVLATKGGNRFERGKDGWTWDPSKHYIKAAVKESLLRLQTDYIDLYQLHGGTIEDPIDETIAAFEELQAEGVIRYYGLSSIRPNVIREYVKRSSIVSVMMQYSIFDRRPEELFPMLEENNISVLTRGSLSKGMLTERSLDHAQSQIRQRGYLDYSFKELESLRSTIKNEVSGTKTLSAIALNYCLYHPIVASVVTGASTVEQVKENIQAVSSGPLRKQDVDNIQQLAKQSTYEQHR